MRTIAAIVATFGLWIGVATIIARLPGIAKDLNPRTLRRFRGLLLGHLLDSG